MELTTSNHKKNLERSKNGAACHPVVLARTAPLEFEHCLPKQLLHDDLSKSLNGDKRSRDCNLPISSHQRQVHLLSPSTPHRNAHDLVVPDPKIILVKLQNRLRAKRGKLPQHLRLSRARPYPLRQCSQNV